MAGLQVGPALGRVLAVSVCGQSVPVPHVPGHPTSICEEDVNYPMVASFCLQPCFQILL